MKWKSLPHTGEGIFKQILNLEKVIIRKDQL